MERHPHDASPESPELYVGPHADELDDLDGDVKPAWPKVIGIISIALGSLGIVCGGVGIASPFLMAGFLGQLDGGAPPALTSPNPLVIGFQGFSLIWTIVLITAGALTVGRKPAGRGTHLIWAVGGIILAAIGIYFQIQQQASIAEWVRQNPDAQFSKGGGGGGGIGASIGLACGVIFGFGYPIFIAVWFGLVKRKPSDITQGVTETVA